MAGAEGLEPSARGFGDRCSTNCAIPLYFYFFDACIILALNLLFVKGLYVLFCILFSKLISEVVSRLRLILDLVCGYVFVVLQIHSVESNFISNKDTAKVYNNKGISFDSYYVFIF